MKNKHKEVKKEAKLTVLLPKKKLIQIAKGAVDFYFQGYEGDLYRYLTDIRRFNRVDVLMAMGFYFDLFALLYKKVNDCTGVSLNYSNINEAVQELHSERYKLRDEYSTEAGKEWEIQKLKEELEEADN